MAELRRNAGPPPHPPASLMQLWPIIQEAEGTGGVGRACEGGEAEGAENTREGVKEKKKVGGEKRRWVNGV